MRRLFIFIWFLVILFSCTKADYENSGSNSNNNSSSTLYETLILGRWKLSSITQICENPSCTAQVYNIDHPDMWIDFTNSTSSLYPCYKITILGNCSPFVLNFDDINCNSMDFSSLESGDLGDADNIPGYGCYTEDYIIYYSFSSDKKYLSLVNACPECAWEHPYSSPKIESLTSTELILSLEGTYNSFIENVRLCSGKIKKTIVHFKKAQ